MEELEAVLMTLARYTDAKSDFLSGRREGKTIRKFNRGGSNLMHNIMIILEEFPLFFALFGLV